MSHKEYILTWQWKDTKLTDSCNSLTTIHKSVVDSMIKQIKDNAVNINLIEYP